MFYNMVPKIFGKKGDEISGEWRKLHNSEFYASNHAISVERFW